MRTPRFHTTGFQVFVVGSDGVVIRAILNTPEGETDNDFQTEADAVKWLRERGSARKEFLILAVHMFTP